MSRAEIRMAKDSHAMIEIGIRKVIEDQIANRGRSPEESNRRENLIDGKVVDILSDTRTGLDDQLES